MEKAGVLDDCDACDDCMEAAAKLSPEDVARLPLPGEGGINTKGENHLCSLTLREPTCHTL
jgi:hypothetical protein